MHKLLIYCTITALLLTSHASGQIYHVDPNNYRAEVPDNLKKEPSTGIMVYNNYSQNFKVLISNDNVKWDTIMIGNNSSVSYNKKELLLKIYTSPERYKFYKLLSGFSYAIQWDKTNKNWVLQ